VLPRALYTWVSAVVRYGCVGITKVKKYKEPYIRVNICWEVGEEKKCVTLPKEEAYATRDWVEANNGCVFWFQALPD
jgi:hypothetical protein